MPRFRRTRANSRKPKRFKKRRFSTKKKGKKTVKKYTNSMVQTFRYQGGIASFNAGASYAALVNNQFGNYNVAMVNTPASADYYFCSRLGDIPNIATYNSMWDEAKIINVKINVIPVVTMTDIVSGQTPPSANTQVSDWYHVTNLDYDGTNTIAWPTYMNMSNVKVHNSRKKYSVQFHPHSLIATYDQSGTRTGWETKPAGWSTITNSNEQYYGCHIVVPPMINTSASNQFVWDVVQEVTVKFRGRQQ